jgi:hypothetical protein
LSGVVFHVHIITPSQEKSRSILVK